MSIWELAGLNVACAIVSAKWLADAGKPQFHQLLAGFAALFVGPLMLLALYVRGLYEARRTHSPAARWF